MSGAGFSMVSSFAASKDCVMSLQNANPTNGEAITLGFPSSFTPTIYMSGNNATLIAILGGDVVTLPAGTTYWMFV
jgi:hypothetical protein